MTDIAILHGNYLNRGGGERVADELARVCDAPLYYGFGNESAIPDDDVERIQLFDPNTLSKWLSRKVYQYRDAYFMWYGAHRPELFEYDVIIQSGNEFGWYVPKQLDQTILKYVHSPPRGPYDMHYKHGDSALHRAYSLFAKVCYGHTTSYVDHYLANSEVVANRCRKAWNIEPEVIYPPVEVHSYGSEYANERSERTFLTFSRLYRHKRTREIVQSFADRSERLIVGGDGPQREHLEGIATPNVEIRGYLSEAEKKRLLAEVEGLIFNAENEDFGIVPVEAMASGTPVIGIDDGFTKYQIRDGKNGITYPVGTPQAISDGVDRFIENGVEWTDAEIAQFANQFSRERFVQEINDAIETAQEESRIDPQLTGLYEMPADRP